MAKPVSLVFIYIYLAVACALVGVVLTFALILASRYFGIDLFKNWWLLGVPVTLAVLMNVCLIELYRKYRNR